MTEKSRRGVVDTNRGLSALVFQHGRLLALRLLWEQKRIEPIVSSATAKELMRALAYPKFKLSSAEQKELLADYLPFCTTVRVPDPPPVTPLCRDEGDVPFLQLALAGKADALVTGDKDLLVLAGAFCCPIVTADAFLAGFSEV